MDIKNNFFATEKAIEQIRIQLEKRNTPNSYLRIGLKGGSCSGFSYHIEFEDNAPREKDLIFKFNDIQIIIDPKSIIYLNGTTLDWEYSLNNQGFKFVNPNAKSLCGCSKSFSV